MVRAIADTLQLLMTTDTLTREFHANILRLNGGVWFHFEPHVAALYRAVLRSGSISIDGGANIGFHTIRMAQAVEPNGKVIAIEPVPESREQLLRWSEEHKVPAGIIELTPYGLSDSVGMTSFYQVLDPVQHELSGMRNRDFLQEFDVKVISVDLTTLDVICDTLPRVDFIKLDVEGAELAALRGGIATLERFRPVITLELSQDSPRYYGYTWTDVVDYFNSVRYELYDLFGFRYFEPSMLEGLTIWDFVALPTEHLQKGELFKSVRQSMQECGVIPPEYGITNSIMRSNIECRFAIDQIGPVSGFLTSSEPIHVQQNTIIQLVGWALSSSGTETAGGVEFAIDDSQLYQAIYGRARNDVEQHFRVADIRNCGFLLTLPAGTVDKGIHSVNIRILMHDRQSYFQAPPIYISVC